ncbi:hypothetical protein L484_008564 [Morus notabilis]|uniref:Uncharacterized protein n=1 Tax=Morus notabilis TaxID=981085 RepID=W9RRH1_9ROSA|nr:hypothetical protein L484_008564 [Morus notabilis]
MPDLGNLSFSASLTVTRPPSNFKSLADPPDPGSVKTIDIECNWDQRFRFPSPNRSELSNGGGIRVVRRSRPRMKVNHRTKKPSNSKSLEDHVRDWVSNTKESGVPESRCSLPFLVGAKKMVECLVCHSFIYPGEEACFICKQKSPWRCVRCAVASHSKCAPWPDEVIDLKDRPGQAVCWRHPIDWRLDGKNAASTSNIEEVFCRLPLPYADEEFKIDFSWKDAENEPPPYVHIKRSILNAELVFAIF